MTGPVDNLAGPLGSGRLSINFDSYSHRGTLVNRPFSYGACSQYRRDLMSLGGFTVILIPLSKGDFWCTLGSKPRTAYVSANVVGT